MRIAVIDYNAGNIRSVYYALQRLGYVADVTRDPERILSADKVIFPGVGEASTTMHFLHEYKLSALIPDLKQPVLGICLGMQLMCSHSEEGNIDCLGIIPARVKRFIPQNGEKVPHMGWNELYDRKGSIFTSLPENPYVYFVHSYYVEMNPWNVATCKYVNPFSAAVRKDNFYATQFHPEKSGPVGELILNAFLAD
jgi:glutamine amidotransferase